MSSFKVVRNFRARLRSEADKPLRTNAPLAIALGAGACLAGFVLLGPLASRGVADDAGALSFLLGEGRARATQARASAPMAPSPGFFYAARPVALASVTVHQPRRRLAAMPSRQRIARARTPVIEQPVSPSITRLVFASKTMSPLDDFTLQRGDAVMTAKGLRIFQGSRRYPFEVADFLPLATVRQVAHRNTLLAIDRIVPAAKWSASFSVPSPIATIVRQPDIGASAVRTIEAFKRS